MYRNAIIAASLLLSACAVKVGDLGDLTEETSGEASASAPMTTSATEETGETATTDPPGTSTDPTTGGPVSAGGVDILFVIDNSGSMAEEQRRLGAAILALVDPLLAADLDLRIAVTTTDAGNPRCPEALTTPENGAFQVETCRAGVANDEWLFADQDLSHACVEVCPHETLTLSATATAEDPEPKARPWIEWGAGGQNVDVPLGEALGCILPQGVNGCGFESQLESMFLALSRTQDPADPAFGFLRTDADLLVVIVTDESDCSRVPAFEEIFTTNKVFWNSPDDATATSAACWRAGITCTGGPGVFDDCVATDHDVSGAVTMDPTKAVLQPLSRYQGVLSTIAGAKQAAGSSGQVHVAAIAGVPIGYPGVPLVYSDGDLDTQASYGIGPGCQLGDALAVPPGRILEVVGQTAPLGPGLFSICEHDFASSLAAIADSLMK